MADPMLAALVQVSIIGAGLWLILLLHNKINRWLQAASALYGATAILQFMALPVIAWLIRVEDTPQESLPLMAISAFNLWLFAISTYILKQTLEVRWTLALILTFIVELTSAMILLSLFNLGAPVEARL